MSIDVFTEIVEYPNEERHIEFIARAHGRTPDRGDKAMAIALAMIPGLIFVICLDWLYNAWDWESMSLKTPAPLIGAIASAILIIVILSFGFYPRAKPSARDREIETKTPSRGEIKLKRRREREVRAQMKANRDRAEISAVANLNKEKVESWISRDLERACELSRSYLILRNLTSEKLRESRLPDDCLSDIETEFVSRANIRYRATHYTEGPKGPFILLKGDDEVDVPDFRNVVGIVARETGGIPERKRAERNIRKGSTYQLAEWIRIQKRPTQSSVADFVDICDKHFREVKVTAAFRDVPYEGDLRQYVKRAAAQRILDLFDEAESSYAHAIEEEDMVYFWEDHSRSDVPKGLLVLTEGYWPYDVTGKLRKMKELYRQVLEEMGLYTSK